MRESEVCAIQCENEVFRMTGWAGMTHDDVDSSDTEVG